MARPRGGEWLEQEIEALARQRISVLVSLLDSAEVSELGLQQETTICVSRSITFLNLPIPDRDVPRAGQKIEDLIGLLGQKMSAGAVVVIHCRMGIGRSSIIAGSVLLLKGWKTEEIIGKITAVRGLKVPDTEEQVRWLRRREQGR